MWGKGRERRHSTRRYSTIKSFFASLRKDPSDTLIISIFCDQLLRMFWGWQQSLQYCLSPPALWLPVVVHAGHHITYLAKLPICTNPRHAPKSCMAVELRLTPLNSFAMTPSFQLSAQLHTSTAGGVILEGYLTVPTLTVPTHTKSTLPLSPAVSFGQIRQTPRPHS